jgi:hypothetical protein
MKEKNEKKTKQPKPNVQPIDEGNMSENVLH